MATLAQAYRRSPLAPWPALRCRQAPAGIRAASWSARSKQNRPDTSDWLQLTASTCGQVVLLQPAPQPAIAAIDRIGGHPGDRHPGVQGPLQHPAGQLRLGVELDLVRDPGLAAAPPVVGPALGQVQLPVHQRMPVAAGVGQEHADLAVLDPPGRARILALDAGRLGALLQEPGLIHDQHAARVAQVLDHIVRAGRRGPRRGPSGHG